MKAWTGAMLVVLTAGLAEAQVVTLDGALNGAAITALLTGRSLAYDDGSRQVFKAGGETVYDTGAGSRSSAGRGQVTEDRYCSVWPPSDVWACYDVTQTADGVGFVADDGSATMGNVMPSALAPED